VRVAFRVDASLTIGTGHVMRCLTFADALRAHGDESVFLSRDHVGHLHQAVEARGYPLMRLGVVDSAREATGSHTHWLGVDPQRDANDTLARVAGLSVDWLVVDHYALGASWECTLRSACGRIMAVDDLANRDHAVDALLDQNLGKTVVDYEARVPASCMLMMGPSYALLRPQFAALRAESLTRRSKGELRKLLVTMGGVDQSDATSAVLEALQAWEPAADLEVTVVMGPTAPWREKVIQQARHLPFTTKVLANVRNMATLMRDSDLAIGAAGSTSWERCSLGLPTLQLVLAENQRAIANALSKAGAAHLLERTDLEVGLRRVLDQLIRDQALLIRMSTAAAEVTDGRGAERVVQRLKKGPYA
jgi:UDP-2,4-diacetamido-2,4,6-trideoxy-beta-L-altropyranose hydrolase